MLNLRDYQEEQIAEAREHIRAGSRSILIQSPTGSGKTVVVAKMAQNAASRNYDVWFNVHRRELVKQSVITLGESAGIDVGVVAAGFQGNRHLRVQVCSIGTLRRRREFLRDPSLIIWDECHHIAAASWGEIFAAYPKAAHIGLTATPERLDGTGLGKWFSQIVRGPSVAWLIEHGYLSDYKLFAPPPPNLDAVHMIGGDFNKKELAEAMSASTVTGDVISHYKRHAPGKRMVLFAWSIEASMSLAAKFSAAGIPAEHVDGETDSDERDAIIERFKRGETLVMTNVDLFGEGFDVPAIEAVAMLRPTRSLALFLQQVGRALRPVYAPGMPLDTAEQRLAAIAAGGKGHAIILDHAGNSRMFGLPDDERTWSLDGRKRNRAGDYAAPIRQCSRCYAVSSASASSCKHCGNVFLAVARDIEEVEGVLQEVDTKAAERATRINEQVAARSLDDLIKLAEMRGYKKPEKWAKHVWASRQAKAAARDARQWFNGERLI